MVASIECRHRSHSLNRGRQACLCAHQKERCGERLHEGVTTQKGTGHKHWSHAFPWCIRKHARQYQTRGLMQTIHRKQGSAYMSCPPYTGEPKFPRLVSNPDSNCLAASVGSTILRPATSMWNLAFDLLTSNANSVAITASILPILYNMMVLGGMMMDITICDVGGLYFFGGKGFCW